MGVEIVFPPYPVLCSEVMPREGHGSRNCRLCRFSGSGCPSCPARGMGVEILRYDSLCFWRFRSCPARGMGVEMQSFICLCPYSCVMPREGHGSRNWSRIRKPYPLSMSCPARGMGVEILPWQSPLHRITSCPARGMGVEIHAIVRIDAAD